ncbi:glutathione-specific gamma-glutamylcyclotransferase 1-like isoform X1 [Dermacentor albipictus]|uniref:glutathione-specific gamma-glutamylcyclotransferase 1-like isoform X1 n=1 Tax=Dermacentor albipictus TaxID=60249 RepID=UPI0038FD2D45
MRHNRVSICSRLRERDRSQNGSKSSGRRRAHFGRRRTLAKQTKRTEAASPLAIAACRAWSRAASWLPRSSSESLASQDHVIGRVATLVEREEGQVWGRAFLLSDDDTSAQNSLGYLDNRESQLGGYSVRFVQFRPRDPREEPFPALVYIATPNNPLYLGPASAVQLADEVLAARGFCGANAEYVLKLARFMKEEVPDAWDDHLFTLESLLRTRLKDSWKALQEMSAYEAPMSAWEQLRRFSLFSDNGDVQEEQGGDAAAGPAAEVTSDFVSNVPTRKLRCLDI